ncbi:myeloid zinc finger 1-like isoform X3 [Daktulosphaira vitifoliae]|uniref:myeloid zinc finger 1-like isoform X3 n=1 Tax=Daktulosphaira vitifoliae TaxID=58002 RepID=UPI0021AAE954|nr:myeloid zinc finger 1-like isoform X3 [Daktulosphaira vitifoliae]
MTVVQTDAQQNIGSNEGNSMAINFSASFAACLAAGLKVPRNFMYCIAQENGAPYVLYNKDGHHQPGLNGSTSQWGPGSSQNGYPTLVSSQHESIEQSNEQASQSTISSPLPSPYPTANHSIQGSGTGGDEETPHEDSPLETNRSQSGQYGSGDSSSYYSSVRGGPPHMLSPSSFMSYLKQPGVMLTPLNPAEASGDFPNMPDLLHQQQEMSGKKCSDMRMFKCLSCGKDFKQKATLMQHERIHTDSRPFVCSDCGKRFRQQSHLTQHVRIHANEKPFVCIYCGRTFRQRAILNQHLRIHSDIGPHLVYKNGQLWPQDVPLPQSKNIQYDSNDSCYSPENAPQFPAYFKDAKGVIHEIFGQSGKSLPDVIQHGRSAGMPLYVRCPICNKEFKQKSTLLQHGCIHIESRPYPCVECGKRFRQQSHLTQHLRIHTNEKPFTCIYCGRNFRQRTILNQHLRIHTGEKPYKCLQCGKDFRQKAILDQHTRTHQGERPFCCPMPNCRRRFGSEQEVKRHMDSHVNPHTNKRRSDIIKPGRSPHLNTILNQPSGIVKPEIYFPQCYALQSPFANHHQQSFASSSPVNQIPPPLPTEFKGSTSVVNTVDFSVKSSTTNVSTAAPIAVVH